MFSEQLTVNRSLATVLDTKMSLCKNLYMTIEDLKETAGMAHLNPNEDELAGIFPGFAEMIGFFDTMQAAENDSAAFPEGLASASSALAGASGNYRTVNSGFYRSGACTSSNDGNSSGFVESLLDNAGERDGRFLLVPNVL